MFIKRILNLIVLFEKELKIDENKILCNLEMFLDKQMRQKKNIFQNLEIQN